MGGFRLRTEPSASFFRKTQLPSSPILEKIFFRTENCVCWFNEKHAALSLGTTHAKEQTETIEPTQRMGKDYP
jgi:hypothetical protein